MEQSKRTYENERERKDEIKKLKHDINLLHESLKHWTDVIADPLHESAGPRECALCKKYYKNDCNRCPVRENTNKTECAGTPYTVYTGKKAGLQNALHYLNECGFNTDKLIQESVKELAECAKDEWEYLDSLRLDLESRLEELTTKTKTYSIGDVFYDNKGGHYSVLAQVRCYHVSLIALRFGEYANRYRNPVEVKDVHNITEDEIRKMTGVYDRLEKIENARIVVDDDDER